jgi:septation ring formation regulator EzrA
MLLMGMPGVTEWFIIIVLLIAVIFIFRVLFGKRGNKQSQVQGQQQQTNLNIHNYSVTAELERLNELKEKGVITQDEFDVQKKKLLSS